MRNLLLIAIFVLPILVGFGSPSAAAPRAHSYIPPARQDVYCLQGRSWVIRVIASSRPMNSAWLLHPAP